ncbi:MAG: 50S ribosomal protein L25 [Spirochaetales bacterium]|nr:50S ribosomal protein L25 [Spirochaetales bacterium]
MEQKTLNATIRTELKKNASGRLRRAGKIPAVMYGHSGSSPVAVDALEFQRKFKRISENTIINLQVDDKGFDVLVKDYEEDILSGKIMHIDFYEIEQGKILRANIPVRLQGTATGMREGGILEQLMHDIEVECLPQDIPETVVVDIKELDVGSALHVFDIEPPDNVKFLASDDQVIAIITTAKEEIVEEVEEELLEGELLEGEEGEVAEGEDQEETEE